MSRADQVDHPNDAERRRGEIVAEIATLGLPLPGSLVERRSRCGSPNCHCHTDPTKLHGPYLSWTRKVNNKTVTRNIGPGEADRYREWMANARRLRELVAELGDLAVQQVDEATRQPPT